MDEGQDMGGDGRAWVRDLSAWFSDSGPRLKQ